MPAAKPENTPVAFVTAATTGLVPVTVYVIPAAGKGAVTVIVPVGTAQTGWIVATDGVDGSERIVAVAVASIGDEFTQPFASVIDSNVYLVVAIGLGLKVKVVGLSVKII